MTTPGPFRAPRAVELAAVHALAWSVVGNAAGTLLAVLLLAPRLGDVLAPLGYGRFAPVHWNAHLYGWLALPLVAVLLRTYAVDDSGAAGVRAGRLAIATWSATLLVGCLSWLGGLTTGKPFLEWAGPLRWALAGQLGFLAAVLAAGYVRGLPAQRWKPPGYRARGVLLAALASVPILMVRAASPAAYPPVDPASGGPTGTSLLGSSLAVVALFVFAPALLEVSPASPSVRRAGRRLVALLAAHAALFLLLAGAAPGDRSNHDPLQIAAVASIGVWPPLLYPYLRRFRWPRPSGPWLAALAFWGFTLAATAVPSFLPGVLERSKFTHALVAHAHLAMAGLCSAFAMLVLVGVVPRLRPALGEPIAFALWNGGTLVHVGALLAVGVLEAGDPTVVIRGAPVVSALYAVRLLAGVAMLGASVGWLRSGLAAVRAAAVPDRPALSAVEAAGRAA